MLLLKYTVFKVIAYTELVSIQNLTLKWRLIWLEMILCSYSKIKFFLALN